MLIEFRATNFRSIRDTQTLSMVAGSGAERLQTNTFNSGLAGIDRLVRSAVIYGANAAGKTNVLLALQFVQNLVVNSATATQQGAPIPHTPFKFAAETRRSPSEFEVTFSQDNVRYEYGLHVGATQVHKEWLTAYPRGRPQRLFERTLDKKLDTYGWHFSSYLKGNRSVCRDATRANALFLSTAIQLNSSQLLPVYEWFQKKLAVIVGSAQLNPILTLRLLEQPGGKEKVLPLLRAADLGISDLEITREPLISGVPITGAAIIENAQKSEIPNIVKFTTFHPSSDSGERVSLDMADESIGTQVLFRSAGAWLNVLANGEVLLFDEIDTSLHPLLTRFLIGLFHSDSTNSKNAQLVFTTHDTSLLEADLFRRDQVWFVEKTTKGSSNLYPLSDFSTRKEEAFERGYLKGRFGALPIIGDIQS